MSSEEQVVTWRLADVFFLLGRVKFRRLQVQPASDEQNDKFKQNWSQEKRGPGWLGYVGDEILPSYI